ncbi:MAG: hypothetical protein GY711_02285 [bacterium]|nr:hypothetical protein [bacterium]
MPSVEDADVDGDGDVGESTPLDLLGEVRAQDAPAAPTTGSGQDPVVDMGAFERPTCRAEPTCEAVPNSSGVAAQILVAGSLHLALSNMTLVAFSCPANTFGIFLCGPSAADVPFGNGVLCIDPFSPGVLRLPPIVLTSVFGDALLAVDAAALPPPFTGVAGGGLHFQFLFRDAAGGGPGFNTSGAVRVTFCE